MPCPVYLDCGLIAGGTPGQRLTGYVQAPGGDAVPNWTALGYGRWDRAYDASVYPASGNPTYAADEINCDGDQVPATFDSEIAPANDTQAAQYGAFYADLLTVQKHRHPNQRVGLIHGLSDAQFNSAGLRSLIDYVVAGPYLATYSAVGDTAKFNLYKSLMDAVISGVAAWSTPKPIVVEFPLQYFDTNGYMSTTLIQSIVTQLQAYWTQGSITAVIPYAGYNPPNGIGNNETWSNALHQQYFTIIQNTFGVGTAAVPYPAPPYNGTVTSATTTLVTPNTRGLIDQVLAFDAQAVFLDPDGI